MNGGDESLRAIYPPYTMKDLLSPNIKKKKSLFKNNFY